MPGASHFVIGCSLLPVPVVYYEVVPRVDLVLEVLKRKVGPLGVAASEAVAEDDANHRLVGELLRVVR